MVHFRNHEPTQKCYVFRDGKKVKQCSYLTVNLGDGETFTCGRVVGNRCRPLYNEVHEPEPEPRDIFEIMTGEEITKLKCTHNCPICGFEFVGYPTGWAWENHIRDCLTAQGRK